MERRQKIKVNEKAYYSGQEMAWTEKITNKKTYKKGHVFYHFSDNKITEFTPKQTCFFDNDVCIPGHCYIYILKKTTTLNVYSNEVRINLTEKDNLIYLGQIVIERNYKKKEEQFDSCGKSQGFFPVEKKKDNRIVL